MESLENFLKNIKKDKPLVNDILLTKLSKIVTRELIPEVRIEAMELLKLANKQELGDFLYYTMSDIFNVSCLVLDTIKDRLKKENILPENIGTNFGTPEELLKLYKNGN